MDANAHFFSYMHHSALSSHFQFGNTSLAQGEKEFLSRIRLHWFPSRLTYGCWTSRSSSFSSSPILSYLSYFSHFCDSLTSFCGSGHNPCAYRLAEWLTRPKTQVMSPTSTVTWTRSTRRSISLTVSSAATDATIVSAAEDPEVPCAGASSSSKQTAASIVPTLLGSLGASLWKQQPELVDSRVSNQGTGANVDRESVVSTISSSL